MLCTDYEKHLNGYYTEMKTVQDIMNIKVMIIP